MKKSAKKVISILLCLAIAAGLAVPSFAAPPKTAFIVVSGMNTFPLYKEDEQVYPMGTKTVVEMAAKLLPPLLTFVSDRDVQKLGDGILPVLRSSFAVLGFDRNGNSVYDITTRTFDGNLVADADIFLSEDKDELAVVRAGIEKFGAENTFFFNYDWRADPLDHADSLNAFIKNVKAETKCGRVALAAFSMGGTVTCSYLEKYGSSDLDVVMLCSTAFQGTTCMGSLFTGDLSFDMFALVRRLSQLTRDNTAENIVDYLNELLEIANVNTSLENIANGFVNKLKDKIYSEFIIPVFGFMPGLWALVNDDCYEQAKAYMLDETENSRLIERIDYYHYNVQEKAQEILANAQRDTNVYIIAQYNMQGLPVSETSANSNNDYLIDAALASGGAVCADLDKTLGDGYKQAVDCGHNHLSADGQIDASTCMFPEHTWFVRDMGHVDYPHGASTDFLLLLAESENYLTVFDRAEYPQFLKYSYGDNTLVPVTQEINNATAADSLFAALTKLTYFAVEIIGRLLGAVMPL